MKTFSVLLVVMALAACSTVAGVGQDIKSSADWTKDKMSGK
jgi:predicted small secreted protein